MTVRKPGVIALVLPFALVASGLCTAAEPACVAPQTFAPGVISTEAMWEWRLALSPSRDLALWHNSKEFLPPEPTGTILLSHRVGEGWSTPEVAPFSGKYVDFDPAFSPDGSLLFFSSKRPVNGEPRKEPDLWMVRRTADGWSAPEHLGMDVNSEDEELYPSVDNDGTLYFGSNRGGQFDVWRSHRDAAGHYGAPERLGAGVNTPDYWEFNPEISPNGKTLLFVGLNRPDGLGYGDIYVSRLRDGVFTPAKNLGPCVNSVKDDFHPTVLWPEQQLIFVRNPDEAGRNGDFNRVPLVLPAE
ncbi:TolB family protein [Arenimonas oryziterrae]|uniref:Uncharacterized protein n=1 Tax=Arenimonas oryziterrae DSM 21050 = YC6267 TaxID=1121015 RepID=A0A091AV74_9GAMM|nr:PD40 domain-containing protein [Arenimonas oryziterrae]KFN42559.1 hypothetical protein N789_13040 [Arenimonas oryziterrae DSM 21050 = YC6267]